MSGPRLLSIHTTLAKAIRSQRSSGGIVKQGGQGTTTDRPWGVWKPPRKRGEGDG